MSDNFNKLSGLKTWKQNTNGVISEIALKDMTEEHLDKAINVLKNRIVKIDSESAKMNYNKSKFESLIKDITLEIENRTIKPLVQTKKKKEKKVIV